MALRLSLACLFFRAAAAVTLAGLVRCPTDCGGTIIPYPYGIGEGCYLEGFDITCNTTFKPYRPFLSKGNIPLLEVLLHDGLLRIDQLIAKRCYDGPTLPKPSVNWMNIENKPYKFTDQNRFVAIGCDTLRYIIDGSPEGPARFSTGCASICDNITYVENRTCSGIGCCETPIPKGLQRYHLRLDSYYNHTWCLNFSPCSFAFVADGMHNKYFNPSNFTDLRYKERYPVTLEWSIGSRGCEDGNVCMANQNSNCYSPTNVEGYRCYCSKGFTGNPYVTDGCVDIDECQQDPCIGECYNLNGSYRCTCPNGMVGDGFRHNGEGCKCIPGMEDNGFGSCIHVTEFPLLIVILGIGLSVLFIVTSISWIYLARKRNKLLELKEEFFKHNGGVLLQEINSSAVSATKIYTSEDLRKATANYSEVRILGRGAYGTVYKGILPDERIVAVKKSKITSDKDQIKQFINEVVILSRIKQENIVELLGCCLETQAPMLVYEFIPNGTLFEHIHSGDLRESLSWYKRRRIMTEIAKALAYLHSIPIIHRDIKSSNILLRNNYTAIVSDFGTSRSVPFDQNYINSLIRGTFGYLDPEYFQSGVFTDKSDVYSFGVVLIELLTGKKVVFNKRNLVSTFISCMNENRAEEILEELILREEPKENIMTIAELAERCVQVKREDRPNMKQIYKELGGSVSRKHEWVDLNDEESMPFFMETMTDNTTFSTANSRFTEDESSETPILPFEIMG